ncbi:hypothetical protein RCH14_000742 [Massilia sp. MP_M2]|uniref:hypothetical protein n=1 Tax=Massilia sp. MP_M2 TaxID=3071713 RepID=UPI00319D9F31
MSARLQQYRMLWQAAHVQIHPRAQTVLWSAIAILTVAVAALMGAAYGVLTGLGWALCTPAGLLLFDWTMALVPGALGMNTPANAQLVPAMRARLVELVLLVWFAAVGLLAAGLQLIPAASHLVLPFAMAGTLGVATLIAGVGAGLVLMLPFFFPFLSEGWQEWLRDAAAQPGVMPLLAAAIILLVIPVVRALFPRGGERHWAMREHLALLSGGSGSSALWEGTRRYSVRRFLARHGPGRHTPGALLLHALGPNLFYLMVSTTIGAALAFAAMTWHLRGTPISDESVPTMLMIGGTMLCFLFPVAAVPFWLARTRGEQALVRLAPVSPVDPARFNALLARAMLRQGLAIWAWASAVSLLLALAIGARGIELVWQACLCCVTLSALALLLRDHARAPRWGMVFYGLAALGLSFIGPILAVFGAKWLGWPIWSSATVSSLMLTGVLVHRRWRRMCDAPIAFPVGRLG